MMTLRLLAITVFFLAGCVFAANPVLAQTPPATAAEPAHAADSAWGDWAIYGSNTARYEHYRISGDRTASPYLFDDSQMYDEFDVNFSRSFSPYRRLNGQIFGLVNGSDYRNIDDGVIPERLNLTYEDGESSLPFKVELGDYFANIGYRTLQRSLKGAQVELQPSSGNSNWRQSILFTSGANQPYYRHFDAGDDYTNAVSWLVETPYFGRVSLNSVHNKRDANYLSIFGGQDARQWVNSIAIESPFTVATQRLTFTGELAHLRGDIGTTPAAQDVSDNAYFAQLAGRGVNREQPLDYRLRFEQYDKYYQPAEAVIQTDRRSEEAHLGWRFDSGLYLRGRTQFFTNQFDTANEKQTNVYGANLSGPFLPSFLPNLIGNIDGYRQTTKDDFRTIAFSSETVNANLSYPFTPLWSGQLGLFYQNVDDDTATQRDRVTRQVGLTAIRQINFADWLGSVSLGATVRDIEGRFDDALEWQPTFGIDLARDAHRVALNYGYLAQNRQASAIPDIGTQTFGLDYSYSTGAHEFGVYANFFDRNIDAARNTIADRIGVYWTYRFNQPSGGVYARNHTVRDDTAPPPLRLGGGAAGSAEGGSGVLALLSPDLQLLTGLPLDERIKETLARLKSEAQLNAPSHIGRYYVFETPLIAEISERQRLVIEEKSGGVYRTSLLIDPDATDAASVEETLARVREAVIASYGTPSAVLEQGELGSSLQTDILSGALVRNYEWQAEKGKLRLGLTRQLDGAVRIEVQHADSFRSLKDTRWGMILK